MEIVNNTEKKVLVVIDPQVDFVSGSLPVKGAVDDMYRIANHIATSSYDKIIVSLDSHRFGHIASTEFWTLSKKKKKTAHGKKGKKQGKKQGKKGKKQGKKGKKQGKKGKNQGKKQGKKGKKGVKKPAKKTGEEKKLAFTMVKVESEVVGAGGKIREYLMGTKVIKGEQKTFPVYVKNPSKLKSTISYIKQLNATGHDHHIWPRHCIQGQPGARVYPVLQRQLKAWEYNNNKQVQYVRKGQNNNVEHFSMFKACVVDPKDPEHTGWNKKVLQELMQYSEIHVCGEAMDFCVLESLKDLALYMYKAKFKDVVTEFSKDELTGLRSSTEHKLSQKEKTERVEKEWRKITILKGGMTPINPADEKFEKWMSTVMDGMRPLNKYIRTNELKYVPVKPARGILPTEPMENSWCVKKRTRFVDADGLVMNPMEVLSPAGSHKGVLKQHNWVISGSVKEVVENNKTVRKAMFKGPPYVIPEPLADKPIYKGYGYGISGNSLYAWNEVQVFLTVGEGNTTIDSMSGLTGFQKRLMKIATSRLKRKNKVKVEGNAADIGEDTERLVEKNAESYSSDEDDSMA